MDSDTQTKFTKHPPPDRFAAITRTIGSFLGMGLTCAGLICGVLSGLSLSDSYSLNHMPIATTHGQITQVSKQEHDGSGYIDCKAVYLYSVGGRSYKGSDTELDNGACSFAKNDTINIYYDPSYPEFSTTHNYASRTSGLGDYTIYIIGILTGLVGVIGGVFILIKTRNKHATSAQIALIENGLQELGEFWDRRDMTRAEAEAVIDDINSRLVAQNKVPPK